MTTPSAPADSKHYLTLLGNGDFLPLLVVLSRDARSDEAIVSIYDATRVPVDIDLGRMIASYYLEHLATPKLADAVAEAGKFVMHNSSPAKLAITAENYSKIVYWANGCERVHQMGKLHQRVEEVAADPNADQPWLDKVRGSIDVAANPDEVDDYVKLNAVATHFDLHDRQAADAGEPVSGTEMQDYLRDLADRIEAGEIEWGVQVTDGSMVVQVRYADEEAALREAYLSATRLGADRVKLIRRIVTAWSEAT